MAVYPAGQALGQCVNICKKCQGGNTFYPPIRFKEMNMCACYQPPPPQPGQLTYKRTRPCACDPCYGDISCQYASRNLPRWGLPAFIPVVKPYTGKAPDQNNIVGKLPSFNPGVLKSMPLDETYANKKDAKDLPVRTTKTFLQQNSKNPFAVIFEDKQEAEPQVILQSLGQANQVGPRSKMAFLVSTLLVGTAIGYCLGRTK